MFIQVRGAFQGREGRRANMSGAPLHVLGHGLNKELFIQYSTHGLKTAVKFFIQAISHATYDLNKEPFNDRTGLDKFC